MDRDSAPTVVGEPAGPEVPRWAAALAGLLGVGAALAVAELLAGLLAGMPSLLDAVGTLVVDNVPPAVKDAAIDLFGTADKLALTIGTAVVALALGALVGIRAARSFDVAIATFVAFGVLGLVMGSAQPLANPIVVVVATLLSVGAGLVVLRTLLAAATTTGGAGTTSRRAFLARVGTAGIGVAVTGTVGRALAAGSVPDVADLEVPEPVASEDGVAPPSPAQRADDVAGISPLVTPLDEFYRIDTALSIPAIDPAAWSLRIHGMVDREVRLTYDDLLAMDLFERYMTIACVSNEVGGDLVGNARWRGVRLSTLLDRAGVQDGASQVVGRSIDGWTAGFPTPVAFDGRDAMVAVAMNGEPLPRRHGFPARLVVPGLYGYVSATKWLTEIELTTLEGFDAYWVPRGWAKEAPVKTQSRIDVPRDGRRVPAGPTTVAGVAWAMGRGVRAVEVAIDGGDWQPAEVTEPISDDTWVQWWLDVDLDPGSHLVRVRATDGLGRVQTDQPAPPRPDGATGHHSVRFTSTEA